MIKKNDIKYIIIITITFVFLIFSMYILSLTYSIHKVKNDNYYFFDKDKIPSVYKVVGKRKLYYYKSISKNDTNVRTFKYKNIKDVSSDLSKYYDELRNNNFINTSNIDLNKTKGSFELCSYSVDEGKIIIINISYNQDSYIIKITKGKGIINVYMNNQ